MHLVPNSKAEIVLGADGRLTIQSSVDGWSAERHARDVEGNDADPEEDRAGGGSGHVRGDDCMIHSGKGDLR